MFLRIMCRVVVLSAVTLAACAELGEVLWSQTAGSPVPLKQMARAPKPVRGSLLPLTAGGVTVKSNPAAGGTVWSWVWNGIEFINTYDFGREMQSALFPRDAKGSNPTEAGDAFSRRPDRIGSPVHSLSNRGNTQSSRAIPLEFNPQNFGGAPREPVVWKDVLMGKDLTLNFHNLGPVGEYSTYVKVPNSLPQAEVEIPSIYLRGIFNVYWTYDAAKKTLTPVSNQVPDGCASKPRKGYAFKTFEFGGVIISDGTDLSTAHAMGIYGVSRSKGGSVNYFTLWNFTKTAECDQNQKPGTGPSDFSNSKLAAVYGPDKVSAGENTYHTWVMSGSINNVTSYMRSLYAAGVK